MEREAEREKEEEEGSLVRTRKGKSLNVQDEIRSVYLDEEEGTELTEENAGTDFSTVAQATAWNNHGNGEADIEIKNLDILNGLESADENLPQKVKINGLQSCNEIPQKDVVDCAQKNFESVEITCIDGRGPMNMKSESRLDSKSIYSKVYGESRMSTLEPVNEVIDGSSHGILVHNSKAIVEMDVERVLEEQDTHDLYCPNCNSCITKRVILRKRKRTIRGVPSGTKRARTEPILQPSSSESTAATEASHETGPDVFRCLSCFSIFIPTADGFKLFWIFRRNNQGENMQRPQQTPTKNLSWISAIFEPFRAKNTRNMPGMETSEFAQEDNLQASGQLQNPRETQTGVEINHVSPVQGEPIPGTSKVVSNQQPVKADVNEAQEHQSVKNNSNEFPPPFSETPLVTDGLNSTGKVPQIRGTSVIMPIPEVLSPNGTNGVLIPEQRPQDMATPVVPAKADRIPPVEGGIVPTDGAVSSQNNQPLSSSLASGISTGQQTIIDIHQQEVDTTRRHEWDILKSIVYGGLVESVTSLGVVSSAAGSDANTLNIVALGLANLIGGLFVIAHNLTEIRKEQVTGTDQNKERVDRYQETLGRRDNFRRHVFTAVLSYIIFGLIPPTVYGFSFRKSDNKEYKMIAVAAASLACIALLSIGKAHVGRAPRTYAKTLFYYISIGVTASGLSYVAGQLLNQLLEKLGLFNSRSAASTASIFLDSNSSTGLAAGWASS